jgi:hypothetical protein
MAHTPPSDWNGGFFKRAGVSHRSYDADCGHAAPDTTIRA